MRLTIINQFYKPDIAPTAYLAASLAEHRARRGDEVTVIAGKGAYAAKGAHGHASGGGRANPRVLRVWTPGLGKANNLKRVIDYGAFYLFALWKLLTLPRQDVIISLTTPPLIAWAASLHKLLHRKSKLILWNMDCYPDAAERAGVIGMGGFLASRIRGRNRAIFRRLDHLICLDRAMAELLCEQYASVRPKLPVTIIPNFEEASFFPRDASYQPQALDGVTLDGRFVVLYMGNMGYGHQFDTALDAAERLRDTRALFLFVGGGRNWQTVKDEAAQRRLDNVVVHPYIPKDRTGPVMASAHCALVTLRDDALGVMSPSKIHANLALGLPLVYVGPAKSNVDEAISGHACGVSLRHRDVDGLVSFVRRVMESADTHGNLRQRARAAFDAAYCDLATMPRFDAVIEHALTGKTSDPSVPTGTASDYAGAVA